MGIIKRQGIKQSLVNYLAVFIAAWSTVFIYPQDTETYGLLRFLIDTSLGIAPFLMLGFGVVTVRFFPHFRNETKGHQGFLFFIIGGVLVGSVLFVLLAILFNAQFYNLYADREYLYRQFLNYIIPLSILLAFFQLFFYYSSNFKRIVVPSVFQNLIKITLPVVVLLFVWKYISIEQTVNGIMLNYIIAVVGLLLYVYWLGQLNLKPDFSLLTKPRVKEISTYAFFGLFGSIGSVLATRIDSFMITTMIDFENNGAFAISAFIANAIAIPTNAIIQISSPIVADSFKNNDLDHIRFLYKKSSLNLLIAGFFLFVCIAISIEDLFSIMPNNQNLKSGVAIVLIIGFARIIDMGTSINNQIIIYSKYFRFGFYAILLMAVFNVVTNLILIPRFQIIGAALATLASLTLYNLMKMIFIQWKFKMQPFSRKTIVVVVLAGFCYFLGVVIPSTGNAALNILLRSILIGGIYISAVFYLKISEDFNGILKNGVDRFRKLF